MEDQMRRTTSVSDVGLPAFRSGLGSGLLAWLNQAGQTLRRIGSRIRLSRELEGEVLFDPFSRGRYSTDASIYQIEPLGVVVPRHQEDVARTLQIAAEEGVPVLPRGAATPNRLRSWSRRAHRRCIPG